MSNRAAAAADRTTAAAAAASAPPPPPPHPASVQLSLPPTVHEAACKNLSADDAADLAQDTDRPPPSTSPPGARINADDDGCDMPTDDNLPKSRAKRDLTWWRLAMITFVFTCSGAGGLEQVMIAGGPIVALLGIFVVPIVFVMPQIFVVSEMGAMMPTAAGNVVWVHRAFGRFAGFYNAWIFALTNMVDMAIYPVLFGDYLATTLHGHNGAHYGTKMSYRLFGLLAGASLSLLSAKDVSTLTGVGCVVTIGFIVILFFASAGDIHPASQWNYVEDPIQYSLLGSSLLWLYTGWTSLGSLAGETKNSRVLLHGMSSACAVDSVVYLMALLAALTVAKRSEWVDGFFVTAFDRVIPGIGPYFGGAVVLSTLALYVSAMICYSRSVWGMAEMGWAPKALTKQLPTGAPHVSVLTHAGVAFFLVWFDFGFIVQVEYTVAATSYLLTYAAFLRLRYTEPDAPRPYVVPGGLPFAWALTVLKVVVMGATCVAGLVQDFWVLVAFVGCNIAVFVGYYMYLRHVDKASSAPNSTSTTAPSAGGTGGLGELEKA